METLQKCLRAWMDAEEISAAALAERLGYRSKTTVLRLLHGESSGDAQTQMYEKLRPGLALEWQMRFERALRVEKTGPARYGMLKALEKQLFQEPMKEPARTDGWVIPPYVTRGQALLLGCCGAAWQARVDGWLSLDGIEVIQYLTEEEILSAPGTLPYLVGRLSARRYQATLLRERPVGLPWNAAFFTADHRAYLLYADGENASWLSLPGGAESLRRLLSGLDGIEQTPLYRFDRLNGGRDYIEFTREAYRMERNRAALILKPTPGMQMLPADVVEQSFQDFLSLNTEPISAARETLISIYEKRVRNFFDRKKPTRMILSSAAMLEFARTGVMTDQFFACRPYTPAEREQAILALRRFACQPQASLSFRDGPAWPVSAEAYEGVGALFYPSAASYQSESQSYRELFLPGQTFYALTEQLMSLLLSETDAPDPGETFDRLASLCK